MTLVDPAVALREEAHAVCDRCSRGHGVVFENGEYVHGVDEIAPDVYAPPEPCAAAPLWRVRHRIRPSCEWGVEFRLLQCAMSDATQSRLATMIGSLGPDVMKFALEKLDQTQRGIANLLGVSHEHVCKVLGNKTPMSVGLAAELYFLLYTKEAAK